MDYIFNNAGIAIGGNVSQYGIEDWNQILDVNLRGVINGIQAAYPVMMVQGFGHIVNTASLAGLTPSPGHVADAATKHAVVGLSNSLRAESALMGSRRDWIIRWGSFGVIICIASSEPMCCISASVGNQ